MTQEFGPLRVAHLSPGHGGVANAARQVHAGLLEIGVESRFFMAPQPPVDVPLHHLYGFPKPNRLGEIADLASRRIEQRVGLTGMLHVTSLFRTFAGFDVVHCHGMDSSWFNLHVLPRLDRRHALVWTMHDKHLGTGACGYPEFWGGCERWKSGCGGCPKAVAEDWWVDCTRWVYRRKQRIVASTRMALVAPSRWMYDFMVAAPITSGQIMTLIPNGVDTETFVPLPSRPSRKELHLPADGALILAVASKLDEPRKGLQYVEPLVRRLKSDYRQAVGLVLVGGRLSNDVLARLQGIVPVYALGKIEEPTTLAKVYSACDLLLMTSMIDNFPSVALEALACGTPVAAFRAGGIPDMVEAGRTGILSEVGATDDLAARIGALLKAPGTLRAMRACCRRQAVQDYSRAVQAGRYLRLYHELCDARHAGSFHEAPV